MNIQHVVTTCINKIEQTIKHEGLMFYSKEQQEDIVHDFDQAVRAINQWKAYICGQQIKNVLNKTSLQSLTQVHDWSLSIRRRSFYSWATIKSKAISMKKEDLAGMLATLYYAMC